MLFYFPSCVCTKKYGDELRPVIKMREGGREGTRTEWPSTQSHCLHVRDANPLSLKRERVLCLSRYVSDDAKYREIPRVLSKDMALHATIHIEFR